MSSKKGKLYLIPTTLGDVEPLQVVPITVKEIIENLTFFIAENEKTARKYIKKITPSKNQASLHFNSIGKYASEHDFEAYLNPCNDGKSIGLLSEAGVPGVADPGAAIVALAHKKNIQVVPLVGPSSILLAMMASGMNGQNFAFNGYLPIDAKERKQQIKFFEKLSFEKNQSQIFIETPYRNDKLFADLLKMLHPNSMLCIAADITLPTEYIKTLPLKLWKQQKVDLHKKPTIFIIHKYL